MRLFVALNLPEAEKQRLSDILETLRASPLPVRWVQPDSLHLTLKFLGEVPESNVDDVGAAVQRAARELQPFDLVLEGFGMFPSRTRPRVFWVGVEPHPQLLRMQAKLEDEIEPLGYPREKRRYSPHLTLGRAKNEAGRLDLTEVDRIGAAVVYKAVIRVGSIDLMRSHLSPKGARYERVGSWVV